MPDHGSNPEQKVLESSFSEDLQKALNALSPEQRLLITLADVEGVAYKEIAEILGKPVGTIRSDYTELTRRFAHDWNRSGVNHKPKYLLGRCGWRHRIKANPPLKKPADAACASAARHY